ncbi:MAG TPA: hypothetical protein VF805_08245 [Anaeromyxobacteraceae bacterium]
MPDDETRARTAAWQRVRALPGADDATTISGQPATRAGVWNLAAMMELSSSTNREAREDARVVAGLMRNVAPKIEKIRQRARARTAPLGVASPDTAESVNEFWVRVYALLAAFDAALGAVPTTARPEWGEDDVDRAPTAKRLASSVTSTLVALGLPAQGTAVQAALIANSIEQPPQRGYEPEAADRAKKRARRVRAARPKKRGR